MFGKTRGLHHCSVRVQRHHHFRRQSWARFYFDSRALVSYGLLDVICLDHESFYQVSLDNLTHAQNEVYSSKFSEWLKSELNLDSNRGYIIFQDPGRSHVGWDSPTIYCRYSAPELKWTHCIGIKELHLRVSSTNSHWNDLRVVGKEYLIMQFKSDSIISRDVYYKRNMIRNVLSSILIPMV